MVVTVVLRVSHAYGLWDEWERKVGFGPHRVAYTIAVKYWSFPLGWCLGILLYIFCLPPTFLKTALTQLTEWAQWDMPPLHDTVWTYRKALPKEKIIWEDIWWVNFPFPWLEEGSITIHGLEVRSCQDQGGYMEISSIHTLVAAGDDRDLKHACLIQCKRWAPSNIFWCSFENQIKNIVYITMYKQHVSFTVQGSAALIWTLSLCTPWCYFVLNYITYIHSTYVHSRPSDSISFCKYFAKPVSQSCPWPSNPHYQSPLLQNTHPCRVFALVSPRHACAHSKWSVCTGHKEDTAREPLLSELYDE